MPSATRLSTTGRDYHRPNFSTRHLLKDVLLVLQEAAARGLATDALTGLPPILERCIANGLGDLDYSALYDVVNPPGSGSPPP